MALDEPKEEDLVIENNEIKFVLDTQTADVLRKSGGLTVDYLNETHRKGYMLSLGSTSDCDTGGCNGCG